jgi:hypothetical protein
VTVAITFIVVIMPSVITFIVMIMPSAITFIVMIMPSAITSFFRDKNWEAAAAGEQQDCDDDVPHAPLHMTFLSMYLFPFLQPS